MSQINFRWIVTGVFEHKNISLHNSKAQYSKVCITFLGNIFIVALRL